MTDVRVAGVGLTRFGSHADRAGRDLFAAAAERAFEDAGVPREDVEELNYGNFMGALAEHQGHLGPLAAEAVGLDVPSTRYESACASSGVAAREAVRLIRSGEADALLVGGAERMNNLGTAGATEALAIAADDLYEVRAGMTFPGAYALMARAYFEEFGGSREDLAHVAVKNHEHALPNEYAQLQKEITVGDVLDAPMIADRRKRNRFTNTSLIPCNRPAVVSTPSGFSAILPPSVTSRIISAIANSPTRAGTSLKPSIRNVWP
jgi:acetyl-CoA acetyltransferase